MPQQLGNGPGIRGAFSTWCTSRVSRPRVSCRWAYSAVVECYGCSGCDTYPTEPIVFSENQLAQAGKPLSIPGKMWQANPKPAVKQFCNEATKVADNGDATISFV